MRDYGKVSPTFWTGTTGRLLRKSQESQIVALYLMTCPQANMLGLFYMPLLYIAHETGLGLEGASKGLQWACQSGFCSYDNDSEMVWIHEMAKYQIGEYLKPTDKRCIGAQNEYNRLVDNPYLSAFYDKYSDHFHLSLKREFVPLNKVDLEAPCKPLASQEQEQYQEQIQEQEKDIPQKPPKKAAKVKTTISDNFGISDNVKAWAIKNNHSHLEQRLEHFIGACKSKGYAYVDWDQAFQNAIRDNWAKIDAGQAQQVLKEDGQIDLRNLPKAKPLADTSNAVDQSENQKRVQEALRNAGVFNG